MALTANPQSLVFTKPTAAAQSVYLSGGTLPYSILTAPSAAVASASGPTSSPNVFVNSNSLADATLSGLSLASGGPSGAIDAEYTGTGSTANAFKTLSQVVSVTPGQSYTPSVWIDPSQLTNNTGSQPNVLTEFSGSTQNADGSYSSVNGKVSATAYTFTNGQMLSISADMADNPAGGTVMQIGTVTNRYFVNDQGDGNFVIYKTVNGTQSGVWSSHQVSPAWSDASDTAYHHVTFTVIAGSPNTLIATWDNNVITTTDGSLDLTTGSWNVVLYTDSNTGSIKNYAINSLLSVGLFSADGSELVTRQDAAINTLASGRYACGTWTCPTNIAPNSDSLASWSVNANMAKASGGPSGATDFEYTGTGAAMASNAAAWSAPFSVTPGTTYAPSWWGDFSQVTHGAPDLQVLDINGTTIIDNSFGVGPNCIGRFGGPSWACPNNLVPQSDDLSTWSVSGSGGALGTMTVGVNTNVTGYIVTGTGAAETCDLRSPSITVTPGEVISFSCYFDFTGTYSGEQPRMLMINEQTGLEVNACSVASGTSGRGSLQNYAIPAGCTSVHFLMHCNSDTIPSGATLKFAQPMLLAASSTPNYYISSQDPRVSMQAFLWSGQSGGFIANNGGKVKFSQPMLETASKASGYYISSQTPQVQVYAQLHPAAIAASGALVKFSQPMLTTDGTSAIYAPDGNTKFTVTPAGAGGSTLVLQDSTGGQSNVDLLVDAVLALGNPSMTFGNPNAAAQLSQIFGGDGTYSIQSGPDTSIATAVIVTGNALQVTPKAVGSTSVVVQDGSGNTVTQSITVNQTTAQNTPIPPSGQGGYPAHVSVWSSQWADATLLTVLDCTQFSFQNNQFGGPGAGKFTIWSKYEDPNQTANLLAGNRIDTYVYRDTLTQGAASGATSIYVNVPDRFAPGDHIVVYDGVNQTFTVVESMGSGGNYINISPALQTSFGVNATVGTLRYRGLITARTRTPNLDYHTDVETMGYFNYQLTRVVNFGCNERECGWLIYQLLNQYAGEIDITLDPSNFVMTTASDGSINGTGTNQYYTVQVSDRSLLQVIQDIIKTANGAGDTQYSLWIDANNVAHFGALNMTTPTVTYTLNPAAVPGDGVCDVVGDLQTRDQDLTNMYNVYKLTGGQDGSGNPVQVEVDDQLSINQYGQKETYLSFPNITDEDTLKAYGKALLDQTAWPVETANLTLIATGAYASGQDYVQISGFSDGTTLQTNVQSVETSWVAGKDVQQKFTLAELIPNKNRIMAQIAAQHYYANNGTLIGGVALTDRFVQTGLQGSIPNSDTFSLSAGTIYASVMVSGTAELTEFNVPAFTFSPSSDGLWIVAFYYANSDGTQAAQPQIQTYLNTTSLSKSQYIPLYRVTMLGGVIVDATDVRNVGGISTPNITPGSITNPTLAADPNLNTAPALAAGTALSGPVYYNAGSGCYDAGLTFTLDVTNPSWLAGIRMYAVPHGQSFTGNAIPKGDYAPNSGGVYEPVIDGLAAGGQYDLYAARVDIQSNVSAPLLLCTTQKNPLFVDTSSLPAMPANTTPTIVGTPTLAYPNVGNGTYDCDAAVTLDSVGTTASSWLQLIEAVAQPLGSSNKWTIYNAEFANSNGVYTVVYGGLGAGTQYQLGVRYVDFQGQRSPVSVVGTTSSNPIQGFLPTSILDPSGQLPYSYTPGPIKNVVDPNGTLNVAPPGGTTGTLPYSNNGVQFTSTIAQNPDSNGSYLQSNTVVTRNVQPVNILNTQLAQNRYSTNLTNTKTSAGTWYSSTLAGPASSGTVLSNGDQLIYDVGTAMDAGSSNAAQDTLTVGANATVTLLFKHAALKAGGNGILNILFTGGSVSQGANVQQSTNVSGSDQPTISHTTTNGSQTNPHTSSLGSFTSSPSITTSTGTNYVNTQHTGSSTTANTSQASLSYYDPPSSSVSGPSGSTTITATHYTSRTYNPTTRTYTTTDDGTNYTGGGSTSMTTPSNTDGSQQIAVTPTFTGGTDASTFVTVKAPNGGTLSIVGETTNNGVTTYYYQSNQVGAHTITVGANPIASTWDGSGTGTATTYTTSWTSTISYSVRDTVGKNGAWTTICSTPGSTVAPVDAAHEISLDITALNAPSDANGATRIDVQLVNPSGTVVQSWTGVSTGTLAYYTGTAAAGAYTWQYQTVVTSTTNESTSTYTGSITATPSWYQSDAQNYTVYNNNDGAGTAYQTASSTLAPTAAGTEISLVLSSLSCPSDANGSSELVATLTDPNGNVVFNQPITATGTYTYTSAGAVAGAYTWTLFGRIATDNSTGASTYNVTASGYVEWYQNDTTTTTTWYNNAGTSQNYTTPSNTVAPVDASTQLQMVLSSVTTPSNSAGSTALYVTLQDPSGTQVYASGAITAAQTITYSNASAVAGTYTWTIWAAPTSNDTADSTYSCSWSGTMSWYQAGPSGGNTYVLAQDGVTQRLSSTDANVQMSYVSADTVSFKVYSNAGQPVTFQVGLDVHGD